MNRKSALQVLEKFTRTPAPQKRHDDNFVYARCKQNGKVQLYSRTRPQKTLAPDQGSHAEADPNVNLGSFLDQVAAEIEHSHGKSAHRVVARLRGVAIQADGQPPRVADLRAAVACVHGFLAGQDGTGGPGTAGTDAGFRNRTAAQVRTQGFKDWLTPWLHAVRRDPAYAQLEAAGQCLEAALWAPTPSLSLQTLSPHALVQLEQAGLLERFMDLRRHVDPPLRELVAPAGSNTSPAGLQHFGTVESLSFPQPSAKNLRLKTCMPQLKRVHLIQPDDPTLRLNTEVPDGCEILETRAIGPDGTGRPSEPARRAPKATARPANLPSVSAGSRRSTRAPGLSELYRQGLSSSGLDEEGLDARERALVDTLADALDQPQERLSLEHIRVPYPTAAMEDTIIPGFVVLRCGLEPPLQTIRKSPSTAEDLIQAFLRIDPKRYAKAFEDHLRRDLPAACFTSPAFENLVLELRQRLTEPTSICVLESRSANDVTQDPAVTTCVTLFLRYRAQLKPALQELRLPNGSTIRPASA